MDDSAFLNTKLFKKIEDQPVDVSRFIYMLYQDLEFQITRADQKSQIILSTNTILTAVIAGFGIDDGLVQDLNVLKAGAIAAYLLMAIALIVSIAYALSASFPRIVKNAAVPHNLYFFSYIETLPADDYADAFGEMDLQELKDTVFKQIHGKSMVLTAKYKRIRLSMVFLLTAIILLAIAQALQLVA